jgi:phosphoglycerate dehydrogenase-like enzyme
MINVLVNAHFSASVIDRFRTVSPELEIEQNEQIGRQWPEDLATEAEVIFATSAIPHPDKAPNLKWIQTHIAGIEHLRDESIWESDVSITTTSGIHAPSIGQYVMAQILLWANGVQKWLRYQKKSEWPENRWQKFLPDELSAKTLGILGYGSIGREVARLAKGFGMTVLATKRDARRIKDDGYIVPGSGDPNGTMVDRIYPGEATRSMVAECDYVVITLPDTARTRHLIAEPILRSMKPECYLVNVGRGSVINEADLIRALRKGWIAGAGLDVFETEPLAPDNPLWQMENVIISPHIGGFSPNYDERAAAVFEENLRRYVTGEHLLNVVDRRQEY